MRHSPAKLINISVPKQSGFTLVELLVAMAVFALISVTVYSGLSHTAAMRGILHDRYERLAELQRVLAYVERDLLQTVGRSAKTPFGDVEPALQLVGAKDITFTRTGADIRLNTGPQSGLLRLQYVLEGDVLNRVVFSVLDRAQDSKLYPRKLITGLTKFEVQVFYQNRWHNEWPLPNVKQDPASVAVLLPRMLRVLIQSKDGHSLRRTIVLHESKSVSA